MLYSPASKNADDRIAALHPDTGTSNMSLDGRKGPNKPRTERAALMGRTLRIDDDAAPQSSAKTRAFLNVIRSRADLGVNVFIEGPTLLGRDPECTVPLHDFGVSRQHAIITPVGNGQYMLRDLQSTNGTRVNGELIPGSKMLSGGEKIFVGDTVLRFALADKDEIDFHNEVSTLVSTDALTGLPSKSRFDQAFEFALESAIQSDATIALLMMDMDGVKQINDTHGHLFGAHVIGETGRLIDQVIGSNGEACRFGGDEFSAFLPGQNLESAMTTAEKIRSAVEDAGFEKDGISLQPTISVGVACYPDGGTKPVDLIASADKALYRAKEEGKNRVAG
ncbi:MAG: GGDEF domain-containing protein [Planctomycetota bacterium]